MAKYAVISDIHGNLHALRAVFARLSRLDVQGVICLGDIVGYGPHPEECVDMVVRYCTTIISGNHDQAVIDPDTANMFNGAAREAVHWTRDRVGPLHLNELAHLKPIEYVGERIMCVHDSPAPGPTDYVHDKLIAAGAFRGVETPICLLGHTHVPMVFEAPTMNVEDEFMGHDITAYVTPDGQPIQLLEGRRYICNPGSVGQPRDCDPRASFAMLDTDEMTFTVHREMYDIAGAQAATLQAGLPTVLADRLAIGA
jgi:predicted phosphodiesterase